MSRTVHVGYTMGPTLEADEPPWPVGWERSRAVQICDEEWGHQWECVLLKADGLRRVRMEEVVRCSRCRGPRCGHTMDPDPCCLIRHHSGRHVPTSVVDKAWVDDPIARHFGWVKGIPACTETTCTHRWAINTRTPVAPSPRISVEAVQNDGMLTPAQLEEIAPGKHRNDLDRDVGLEILAGKDGAQGWVPCPLGHWIVRQPGDPTDVWPVDPDYFAAKYEEDS